MRFAIAIVLLGVGLTVAAAEAVSDQGDRRGLRKPAAVPYLFEVGALQIKVIEIGLI
jgi:hypothetical protein